MPSLIYDSAVDGMAGGSIAFGVDDFAVMLVNGYVPDKAAHRHRSDVTGEVAGDGYTPGGASVVVTVSDGAGDRADIALGGAAWTPSTITATGGVYYALGGGELVAFIDFGGEVQSVTGAFTLQPSTITINNP